MGLFDSLLSKIKDTIDAQHHHHQEIGDIIHTTIGIRINPEHIKVTKGVLRLTVSPTIRTVVLLKKEALIEALRSKGIYSIV